MTKHLNIIILTFTMLLPMRVFSAADPLDSVYASRADLRAAFDTVGKPIGASAGFLMNLEDWALQYGWREYAELATYAPKVAPPALAASFAPPELSSPIFLVVDDASGVILAASGAERSWPIASITKLITAKVAIDNGIDVGGASTVNTIDDVGGAKLWVDDGTRFTTRDVLAAALVGSANNAAECRRGRSLRRSSPEVPPCRS